MTAPSMARHTSLRAVSDSDFQTAVIPVRGLMVRDGAIRLLTMRVGLRAAPDPLILRGCEAMPPVSRTRCSVFHGAPQSRDPGRPWTPDQQRNASRCAASGARIPHPEERPAGRVSKDAPHQDY